MLRRVLHTADSPRRTAGAFALGVFVGVSPFFGLHTLIALLLAFLLRLNRVAVLLGTLVLNPWTILPIYAAGTSLGFWVLRRNGEIQHLALPSGPVGPSTLMDTVSRLGPVLAPFILGNVLLAAAAGAATYPVALRVIARFRRARAARRARRVMERAAAGDPPVAP